MAFLDIEAGFWGLRRQLESLAGEALTNAVLQQAGANGGASFASAFAGKVSADQVPQALRDCLSAYQTAGFGSFEILAMEYPLGKILIRGENSFEAWMMRQHDHTPREPVCAYTTGVLVGFINALTDRRDIVCVEHRCLALGDDVCTFELLPAKEVDGIPVIAMDPDPALSHQLNLLETLFHRMPMGIAIFDRDFKLRRFNPTWGEYIEKYTQTPKNEIVPGVSLFELAPGSEETILPVFKRVLAGEVVQMEALPSSSGGITSYWDVVFSPLVENGEVGGILDVTTDATARVQAFQELKELNLVLEQRIEDRKFEIERRNQVAESLRNILQYLNSDRSSQEILDYIAEQSSILMLADACLIYRIEEGKYFEQVATYNLATEIANLKSGEIFPSQANQQLVERELVAIPDIQQHVSRILKTTPNISDFHKSWFQAVHSHYKASLGVPLIVREKIYGGLNLYYSWSRDFTPDVLQLASILGEHAALAIENTRLRQEEYERRIEAEQRRRVAEVLRDILQVLNSNQSLPEVLSYIVQEANHLMGSSACLLHRIIYDQDFVAIEAAYGLPPELQEIEGFPLYSSPKADRRIVEQKPIWISDFTREPRAKGKALDEYPKLRQWREVTSRYYRAWLAVPLVMPDRVYGSLAFYFEHPMEFSDETIDMAVSFADQAALAIETARLRSETEQNAIVEERRRLARDLHDAVTQTLFSASLIAEVLPRIWERNPAEGQRRLDELRQLTRGALAEMRTLLLELRPSALLEANMNELLRHLAEAFTGRSRVKVDLDIEGMIDFPPEVKVAFYRVTQEALNNIAKHASATQVTISLCCTASEKTPSKAQLKIADNGVGFDLDSTKPESLGLGIMRERAEQIGATLTINSSSGSGTQIDLLWNKELQIKKKPGGNDD